MLQHEQMPSVVDREISSPDQDKFGHADFAVALQSLVESPDNVPPLSIGLLGPWGTGKSTVKSLYLHSLEDDTNKSYSGKLRKHRVKALTFNAWRYGGCSDGNLKRALLRSVFLELGGSQETIADELFHTIQKTSQVAKNWRAALTDVIRKLTLNLLPALVVLIILLLVFDSTMAFIGVEDQWAKGLFAIIGTFLVTWLAKVFGENTSTPAQTTRIELPRTSVEEYEDLLIRQINGFKAAQKHVERIVIFVDDLDRLSAHEMVDGLDAIRSFMEIPPSRLPDNLGLVFVISCDENRIAEALKLGRRRDTDLPGAVITKDDARRYLDRIFQFRLEIPPLPKQDMRQFALEHIKRADPELITRIQSSGCSIQNVIDRLIHSDVDNPRNALQLVNAFIQSWWLAVRRESCGAGTIGPGGLSDGVITRHPETLAIICSLKVNYPGFYQLLVREPELIEHFLSVFEHQRTDFRNLSPRAKLLLSEYSEGDDDSTLKVQYDGLRRFLVSLGGHLWPESLLPFVLLNQDAVSRKYSGRSLPIYAALVGGDARGLLRELGRDKDSKPISSEDARLITSIIEGLEGDSKIRRDNAAFVIAELTERIPEEIKPLLLARLFRQLDLAR